MMIGPCTRQGWTRRRGIGAAAVEPEEPPDHLRRATFSAGRFAVIRDVQSPLGFAVFFTLVVEGFLALVSIWAPISEGARVLFVSLGFALAVCIAVAVFWLVLKRPQNLVFTEQAHLRLEEMRYGNPAQPLSAQSFDTMRPVLPPAPP